MVYVSSILTLQLKYKIMKTYSEIELREMIANLRLVKEMEKVSSLQDRSELDLTTYELFLENHLENKIIESIEL